MTQQSNLPASVAPSILPVERRLPQPDADATVLVRMVTESLDPNVETVDSLKAAYAAINLPPNIKRSVDSIFDELVSMAHSKEPTVWILNHPHPLASEAKIVRMYHREDGGVDVYSSDGKMFVRTFVPERVIRFCDEAMSEDTFVEFITIAEEEEEEEEEEELPEEPEP